MRRSRFALRSSLSARRHARRSARPKKTGSGRLDTEVLSCPRSPSRFVLFRCALQHRSRDARGVSERWAGGVLARPEERDRSAAGGASRPDRKPRSAKRSPGPRRRAADQFRDDHSARARGLLARDGRCRDLPVIGACRRRLSHKTRDRRFSPRSAARVANETFPRPVRDPRRRRTFGASARRHLHWTADWLIAPRQVDGRPNLRACLERRNLPGPLLVFGVPPAAEFWI
jgi:hypothetical protein